METSLTSKQIAETKARFAGGIGLTKRADSRIVERAYGAILALSNFTDDFDMAPVYTVLSRGLFERLSEHGQKEYEAFIEMKTAVKKASAS